MHGLKILLLTILLAPFSIWRGAGGEASAQVVTPLGFRDYSLPHQLNIGNGVIKSTNPSAALEVAGTTRGLLFPRLATTQRNAISSPAKGLFIFNTTTNKTNYYNGTQWIEMDPSGGSSITNIFNNSVTNIYTLHDTCLVIGVDTLCVDFTICSWDLLSDTAVKICPCFDSTHTESDCVTLPTTKQVFFIGQNWINIKYPGIIQSGTNPLIADTYFPTNNFKAYFTGHPYGGIPFSFSQEQTWLGSPGITRYGNTNASVGLSINYSDSASSCCGVDYPDTAWTSWLGDRISRGYFMTTNNNGYGNIAQTLGIPTQSLTGEVNAKWTGWFVHSDDNDNDYGIDFLAAPNATTLSSFKDKMPLRLKTNREAIFPGYHSASDFLSSDTTNKPAAFDANGNLVRMNYWPGSGGGSQDLQSVTDVGSITTNTIVTRNQFQITPSYLSDWANSLGFSGNGVNAEGALNLREWSTGDGDVVTLSPVTSISGNITLRFQGVDGDSIATLRDIRSSGSVNIYNSNGILTGHRQLSGADYDLVFANMGRFVNYSTADIDGTTNYLVIDSAGGNGAVIQTSNGSKYSEIRTMTNGPGFTQPYTRISSANGSGNVTEFFVEQSGINISSDLVAMLSLQRNGELTLPKYGDSTVTGTPTTFPAFTVDGKIIESPNPWLKYKVYTALISQSGTSDPTATILDNTIGSIVWTRVSDGFYRGTLSGAFTTDKTWPMINTNIFAKTEGQAKFVLAGTQNYVEIYTSDTTGALADDRLNGTSIEIRVYY